MSSYRRTSVFINRNDSYIGSISSFKTNRAARIHAANIEIDESVSSIQNVDPRFMFIEKNPPPPSPKKTPTTTVENWLLGTDKQMQPVPLRKATVSAAPVSEKRIQNLKRHHLSKSASRTGKQRSMSTTRPCVSNHEVSSTNEEWFTPRRRRSTPKEKLRKLHKSQPNSNQRTIDVHFEGCTHDSDECCLHRECSNVKHDCNVVNLCCKQTSDNPKPVTHVERKCPEINRIGDGLVVQPPVRTGQQIIFSRIKQEIGKCNCSHHDAPNTNPVLKVVCPIVIFTMISLSMLSVHYKFGLAYRIWQLLTLWFDTYSLIGLRRPLTKWEVFVLFVNKCTDKILAAINVSLWNT